MGRIRDNEQERWRLMADNRYAVSTMGRVFSFRKMGCLLPHARKDGYRSVRIGGREILVHRAVAYAFLDVPTAGKTQINHKNGRKDDNRLVNIEWVTPSQNVLHAYRELGVVVDRSRRDRIGSANKGRFALGNHFKAIPIICLETGEEFDCIKSAAIRYGISKSSVAHAVHCGTRSNGRYHFSRIKRNGGK